MRYATGVGILLTAAWALAIGSGCGEGGTKPAPPKAADGSRIKVLSIEPQHVEERRLASELVARQADYDFRLAVLDSYYERVGNLHKLRWAKRERKNLREAHTFEFRGLNPIEEPDPESIEGADERVLVELTVSARKAWLTALDRLAQFYKAREHDLRYRLVHSIQRRFDPVYTYMYFLDAEIPGEDLSNDLVIPEADRLFNKAYQLYQDGKGLMRTFLTTDYQKQRQALALFRKLVYEYPRSTKIALSAYYIGEIYKEYFNEHLRAVHWYQRAWQWDPDVPEPARFQAATVYDYHLGEPEKALEFYRESIKRDPYRLLNREHAASRVNDITEKLQEQDEAYEPAAN